MLFSDRDVVEPDLIVVADAQPEIVTVKNIQGVPALLVEIDPDSDRVEVYLLVGDRFGKPQILEAGDTLELDILPGFRLDVAELLTR